MRILHTSDWHLGLELGGHDRLDEQKRFLSWLMDLCVERRIHALLVCGDVYDVANPSVAAQAAFAEFLAGFHRRLPNSDLVIVAGNHDSASRLELPRAFGEVLGGVHLRGVVSDSVQDRIVPLRGEDGSTGAWCVALPFLRAGDLDCRLEGEETPQEAYVRAVASLYRDARESIPEGQKHLPLVAMGHLTLAGSLRAGSERILIGGVESVPVQALSEGCQYVALGHIHRAQTVGTESVRYCGSPYPVDFDEHRYRHVVLEVELEPGSAPSVHSIEVPEFVKFLRFTDPPVAWDGVEKAVEAFDWSVFQGLERSLQPLVELRYDGSIPVSELRSRCEALCAGKPLRLVSAPKAVMGRESSSTTPPIAASLRERETPEALLGRHWKSKFDAQVPDALLTRFRMAVDEIAIEGKVP
ncbi:MAG: exonuclease subunit SbcD [Fibrobacterota bacterium]